MWYHHFSLLKSYLRLINYSMTQNWILQQKEKNAVKIDNQDQHH